MNLILLILSLVDITSGISYIFSLPAFVVYLLLLAKGIWTLFSCALYKDYLFATLGILDSICGILGLIEYFELKIVGVAIFLKGLYSIIFSF